jgi:hypothetical protein
VTLTAGKRHWIGITAVIPSGRASSRPGLRLGGTIAAAGTLRVYTFNGAVPATFRYDGVGAAASALTSVRYPSLRVTYTSPNYTEYDSGAAFYSGTAKNLMVPVPATVNGFIKLQDAVVADGQALTMVACDILASGGGTSDKQTLVLDFGATNQVTYGGANVALPQIDSLEQAGDTFDIGICTTATRTKSRLLWLNKTKGAGPNSLVGGGYADICTISHAAKANNNYTSEYTNAPGFVLRFSGTATVARLLVGVKPVILFGDSQTGTKDNAATAAAPQLLGSYLPTAFAKDRIWWLAAIPGNRMTADTANHTAGSARYKAATAGQGDLCEFRGVQFVYCGYGVNDISAYGASTAVAATTIVQEIVSRLAGMLKDVVTNGNEVLLLGLPPFLTGDAYQQEGVRQLNRALMGLALSAGLPYANPYRIAVVDGGGTHYTAAGAQAVANYAASRWEGNRIDAVESGLMGRQSSIMGM